MKRGLALLVVAAALSVATVALAASSSRTFNDAAGDSGAAPDVTEVQLGTDVVKGPVVLWVTTPNRTAYAGADSSSVFLDTDLNGSTGATEFGGAEYLVEWDGSAALYKWNGTDFVQTPAPTLSGSFVPSEKAVRLEIHPSDLGATRGFNFYVVGATGDVVDFAPNDGLWTYSIEAGPLLLTKESARATAARAGKAFALVVRVGREDINEILGEGKVTCSAKVGKAALRASVAQFVGSASTCAWRIPKTARGKKLTAKITTSYGGSSVSHSHAAVVKK